MVALFGLAFAAAPSLMDLALLRRSNSPDHSAKGTPSGIAVPCGSAIALRQIVDTRFHVLFHSRLRVLFTFPSRYLFTIGRLRVFSLGPWKARVHAIRRCSRYSGGPPGKVFPIRLPGYHRLWPTFPGRSASGRLCNLPTGDVPPIRRTPTTPTGERTRALIPSV